MFRECSDELFVNLSPVFFARQRCNFERADSLILHFVSELNLLLVCGHKLTGDVPHGESEQSRPSKTGKGFE